VVRTYIYTRRMQPGTWPLDRGTETAIWGEHLPPPSTGISSGARLLRPYLAFKRRGWL
jgi:hypothetical protein